MVARESLVIDSHTYSIQPTQSTEHTQRTHNIHTAPITDNTLSTVDVKYVSSALRYDESSVYEFHRQNVSFKKILKCSGTQSMSN